ncbi:unnamed protein product [Musa hybrid cultivar]
MNDNLLESVIIGLSYYIPTVSCWCSQIFWSTCTVGNKSACFQRKYKHGLYSYFLSIIDCFHLIYFFCIK